ncbi:MAG: LysR family transcriptional regulator [Lachnospiraceae bacterium]|nr:LysR family transcriptional regulator [Lachnospiraceae bacterium]
MTIQQLECFYAVARHSSFVVASTELFLTQSAVSKQISHLEKELGFGLFYRTTRSVSLTEEGKIFYAGTEQMLNTFHSSVAQCRHLHEHTEYTLRLGIPENTEDFFFPHLFSQYHLDRPNVRLIPVKCQVQEVQSALRSGKIDMRLAASDMAVQESELEYHHLFMASYCCQMHNEHPLAGASVLRASEFNFCRLLVPPMPAAPHTRGIVEDIRAKSPNATLSGEDVSIDERLMLLYSGEYLALTPQYNCAVKDGLTAVQMDEKYNFSFGAFTLPHPGEQVYSFLQYAQDYYRDL